MASHPVVTIRFANVEDAERIARVHIAAWRAAYTGIMSDQQLAGLDHELLMRRWHHDLATGFADGAVLVAQSPQGTICGVASGGSPRDEVESGTLELWMLNCHPSSWGRGVGTMLLAELERQLADRGALDAYLWVAARNSRARHFYAREGWCDTGATRLEERFDPAITEVRYAKRVGVSS
ncbi:GNAT family N-acetyltransferase [Pseudactinotalea sp. HY158]|uniref:GNAT family N-acetyltransferase n=1 Tax=Pseudactinotalea sp. HY158 TaxID=2654547 RepID=UPI00129C5C20|nr:GNAT family N-acetyltransferase [Pseudactinotalea sp. HY158]QGH70836.1 GNAT family N-acetyltransferase [Pseudactinotalea sp. HY158]